MWTFSFSDAQKSVQSDEGAIAKPYTTSFFLLEKDGSAGINNYSQINPGLSNKVVLVFDINSDAKNLKLTYQDDFNEEYYSVPLGHLTF